MVLKSLFSNKDYHGENIKQMKLQKNLQTFFKLKPKRNNTQRKNTKDTQDPMEKLLENISFECVSHSISDYQLLFYFCFNCRPVTRGGEGGRSPLPFFKIQRKVP